MTVGQLEKVQHIYIYIMRIQDGEEKERIIS